MSRFKLAPSILSADFGRLAEEVRSAETAGADWIHVDVMDGHFVPNLTLGPDVTRAVAAAATRPVDVHLMVERPESLLGAFAQAGADALGVHVEACPHLHATLGEIRRLGVRPCVVLNPGTPAESIRPVLHLVDQVLVMTVNPGFGGQQFLRETLPKIQQIRTWLELDALPCDLVADGGIGPDNVEEVAAAGANVFVMGSAFYGRKDRPELVEEVRSRLRRFEPSDSATPSPSTPSPGP